MIRRHRPLTPRERLRSRRRPRQRLGPSRGPRAQLSRTATSISCRQGPHSNGKGEMIAGRSVGKHYSRPRGLGGLPGPGRPGPDHPNTRRPGPVAPRGTRRQPAGVRRVWPHRRPFILLGLDVVRAVNCGFVASPASTRAATCALGSTAGTNACRAIRCSGPPTTSATAGKVQVSGSWSRLPGDAIDKHVIRVKWKKNSHFAEGRCHASRRPAMPECPADLCIEPCPEPPFARSQGPHRPRQNPDSTSNHHVTHRASFVDSQAGSNCSLFRGRRNRLEGSIESPLATGTRVGAAYQLMVPCSTIP